MLCPVAAHHTEAHDNQRDEEDKDAAKQIVVGGKAGDGERRDFATKRGKCVPVLRVLDEVNRQFEGDKEEEANKVLAKVEKTIALETQRAGQIVGSVILDMVMLDMVIVVRVPCLSKQRRQ